MDVSKNRGKTPKMDGLFHGKPYEQMDDFGEKKPYFWTHPHHVYQLKVLSDFRRLAEVPNARVKEGRFITVAPKSLKFHHFSPVPNWPFFS